MAADLYKLNKDITSIANFPEDTDPEAGVRLYGEDSYDMHMAVLSHYLHNRNLVEKGLLAELDRKSLAEYVHDYLAHREDCDGVGNGDTLMVADQPLQQELFSEFFDVPFPLPKEPRHTFIDLFAGIGGIRIPFDELGYQCTFSSEWDSKACTTYRANFGVVPFGDITKIAADFIPRHDVLLAGFPCQAFSIMGKMQGFADTRGTMFFEIERILRHHRTPYILLENVKQLVGHDGGRTFKTILEHLASLGYHVKWQVLNALDFGLPQKRERVIIVGFQDKADCDKFNFDFERKKYDLASILESDEDVDRSLFISDHIMDKRRQQTMGKQVFYPSIWHENKSGNVSILDYSCALRTGASYNYLLVNGVRRPSSRELLRLQGFPEKYRIVVSHQDIRRQTGNSVAVPMIRMVARKIDEIIKMKEYETSKTERLKKAANL